MTTTDPKPIHRAPRSAPMDISDMILGLKRLHDWLSVHPACAHIQSEGPSKAPHRHLVYCLTPDEFEARLVDLEDGAPYEVVRHAIAAAYASTEQAS